MADTGIGIPAGLTERVFEEFYQVPGVRRGGTGLGLPYARRPVDLVLTDLRMPGLDGGALLAGLPASVPAVVVTGADVPPPPRAAALLRKDELTRERLEFTLRGIVGEAS